MTSRHPQRIFPQATDRKAHLRILATTDLHMQIYPYDYFGDRPVKSIGLSRVASLIKKARQEAPNTLLVDNGDFLQGNAMGDYMAYEKGLPEGTTHPMITAMNVMGFDASTLGNHEFNYGVPFLKQAISGADFPIVSANALRDEGHDADCIPPYVIVQRTLIDGAGAPQEIAIGIIGFAPPQIDVWDRKNLEGHAKTRDILETAHALVPEMKAQGADIVIALAHTGIAEEIAYKDMENAAVPLAQVEGIDAIVAGHHHLVFPGPKFKATKAIDPVEGRLHGKPLVMPGAWGSHLGVIDLLLEPGQNGWKVITDQADVWPVATRQPDNTHRPLVADDPAVLAAVEDIHAQTLRYIRQPVGKTISALQSYFALIANDLSVQIVAAAQADYIRDRLRDGPHGHLPILSAVAPFKAGGRGGPEYYTDVPAGTIAINNVADLYFYPNTMRAVKVTGAHLRAWLDRAAGLFEQITPGISDQSLINPAFPSYNFDIVSGLRYTIDLTRPARFDAHGRQAAPGLQSRIASLTYAGAPVTDDMDFIIATNSYRASGGGHFPGADGTTIIYEAPDTNRDVVARYIVAKDTLAATAEEIWQFAPIKSSNADGATSAVFDTGPAARAYAAQVTGRRLEDIGDTKDGFARFRIHF